MTETRRDVSLSVVIRIDRTGNWVDWSTGHRSVPEVLAVAEQLVSLPAIADIRFDRTTRTTERLGLHDLAAEEGPRCVCGDSIQLMDDADPRSWIHSPGSDTRCLNARPPTNQLAEVMRIVTEYVIESNDIGGLDANDLTDRLEQAGYPLPEIDEDGS
ncbi:hypothetical protein [Streptomyces sp. NPDC002994]|uniref:hypothetical protein n=1 Tax=Streptomyces sp. NPDC002994 TaxID=3154441 RepID=UPI0033A11F4F